MGSLPATLCPPLLSAVAAVGLGALGGLAGAATLLFAPGLPARMRRSRIRLKQGLLLPALISSFELELRKGPASMNGFPVGILWALVHIFKLCEH